MKDAFLRQVPSGPGSQPPFHEVPGVRVGALSSGPSIPMASSKPGLVCAFPCTVTWRSGLQAGSDVRENSLVYEALRIVDEVDFAWMFAENVDGIDTEGNDKRFAHTAAERGFQCRCVRWSALLSGCPPKRERWFIIAWRHGFPPWTLIPMLAASLEDLVSAEICFDFKGGHQLIGPPKGRSTCWSSWATRCCQARRCWPRACSRTF